MLAFYYVQQNTGGRFWEYRSDREGKGRGGGTGLLKGRNEVRLRILYPLDECTVYDLFSSRGHIMSRQQSQPPPIVNNIVCS